MPLLGAGRDGSVKPCWGTPLDMAHPLAQGLIGWWPMNEGAGSALSDLADAQRAALLGAPAWITGSHGDALGFNGTNQAGFVALNLSGYSAITVSFWLWWSANASDDRLAMEFTSNFNSAAGGFLIDPNASGTGGKASASLCIPSGGYNSVEFARPSAQAWHKWDLVFDRAQSGGAILPYLDGTPVAYTKANTAIVGGSFANSMLYLMSRAGSSLFGAGRMSGLAVYGRALSAGEIAGLCADPYGPLLPASVRRFSAWDAGTLKALGETLNLSEARLAALRKGLSDSLAVTEARGLGTGKGLADALALADALSAVLNAGGTSFSRALAETLTLADARIGGLTRVALETLPLAEGRVLRLARQIGETLGFTDDAQAFGAGLAVLTIVTVAAWGDRAGRGGGIA